jgi:hypothetical protein
MCLRAKNENEKRVNEFLAFNLMRKDAKAVMT